MHNDRVRPWCKPSRSKICCTTRSLHSGGCYAESGPCQSIGYIRWRFCIHMASRSESTWPRWSDLDATEQDRLRNRKRKPRVSQASSTQYVFPSWCRTHLLLQQFGRRRPSLSYGRTLHLNCGGRRSFLMTSTSYIIQVIGVCGESC